MGKTFFSFLALLAISILPHFPAEAASASNDRTILYQHCIRKFADAWCGTGAPVDMVANSFKDNCALERKAYREEVIIEYERQGKLKPLQIEQLAEKLITSTEGWELKVYEDHCL